LWGGARCGPPHCCVHASSWPVWEDPVAVTLILTLTLTLTAQLLSQHIPALRRAHLYDISLSSNPTPKSNWVREDPVAVPWTQAVELVVAHLPPLDPPPAEPQGGPHSPLGPLPAARGAGAAAPHQLQPSAFPGQEGEKALLEVPILGAILPLRCGVRRPRAGGRRVATRWGLSSSTSAWTRGGSSRVGHGPCAASPPIPDWGRPSLPHPLPAPRRPTLPALTALSAQALAGNAAVSQLVEVASP
jgi:hypothetical protein